MFPVLDLTQLPNLPLAQRLDLPTCSAIYFALDVTNRVLYVGQATHLRARWQGHHRIEQLLKLNKKSLVRLA